VAVVVVERDGGFVLDVEGAVDKSRVEEVRASNVALANQLAERGNGSRRLSRSR
jgi:hypothetical protein